MAIAAPALLPLGSDQAVGANGPEPLITTFDGAGD